MDTDFIPHAHRLTQGWMEFLIFLVPILLVTGLLFYWAFAIRKRKNRIRKYRRHHHHRPGYREQLKKVAEELRQHRDGRRHEHRRLNPTLAETGGLPPIREADQPPPPAPPEP